MNEIRNMIEITGATGAITDVDQFLEELAEFAQQNHLIIQAFDAGAIYGKTHLLSAVNHARRAMERKANTTNTLAMEILLYASGERQLKLAIPKVGVKSGQGTIAFVLIDAEKRKTKETFDALINELLQQFSLKRDDAVLDGTMHTLKVFGIGTVELQTVTKAKYGDLILEKVAMVDIIK
ncbi:MAG: hypothetical protein JW771_03475 [Candidatus Thermoplasmatota archaeon]|nr:hypothetical protein [Candidatus Thermoplasmatota archaeon]